MCLGAYLLNPAKVKQAAMDSTNIGNQDSSSALASALQTRNRTVQVRPKLYLLRHAESQAKEYNPKIKLHNNDTSIKDPRLNEVGRKQCLAVGNFLTSQGIYATHILSAPLLRALETAYWSFEDLIKSGVKVLAIPELQSMSNGPNGTGMDLNQLKELYGDDTHNPREFSDPKPPEALDLDTKFGAKQADEPKPGAKDAKGDVPSRAETTRDLRGSVDFRFMCEDWNDPKQKSKEHNGKYSTLEKRYQYLRGFLGGLRSRVKEGEPLEVVLAAHSSVLRRWIANPEWDTFEILIWNFDFNKEGTLIMRKPQSWLKQVPAGQTIEQQPHSREEPAVLKWKLAPFSRSGEQQN